MNGAFFRDVKDFQTLEPVLPTNIQKNQPEFQIRQSSSIRLPRKHKCHQKHKCTFAFSTLKCIFCLAYKPLLKLILFWR